MMGRWVVYVTLPALLLGSAAGLWLVRETHKAPTEPPLASAPHLASPDAGGGGLEGEDDRAFSFRSSTGEPSSLTCEAARSVVAQVRGNLAFDPEPVSPHSLAVGTADWLDPHGLLRPAADSPVGGGLVQHAVALLRDLESEAGGRCEAALVVGRALVPWTTELGK